MATSTTSLLDLPDELIIKILDYIDLNSLIRSISCTCQRLHQLSNAEKLWKKFCRDYWLDETRENSVESWKENFLAWHRKMGKYMGCYARVKACWNRIENALAERSPSTKSDLKGPADEAAIEMINAQLAEKGLDCCLPPEVACSYLIHDGQMLGQGLTPLHGCLEVYDHLEMEVAVPLAISVKNALPSKGYLILSWCPYTNYGQELCLTDRPGLERGNVYYHCNQIGRGQRNNGYFLLAKSYMEWLEKLADRLNDPELVVEKSQILRFYHEPTCIAVTRDVKVTVATAFVPCLSQIGRSGMQTLFAYRVSMCMEKRASPDSTCKLQTRHWEITDTKGEYHEVNGEAVIGLYPVIKPGTNFSYCSQIPFDCEGGFMEGHFTFVNLKSGETYDVICPRFNMKCPPISMVPEEDYNDGEDDSEEEDY